MYFYILSELSRFANIKPYLFLIFCFFASLFTAQNKSFSYQHYGAEDGLSNSTILSIKQGPNGLMYMVTPNGIYSYDGYNFIKIKTENYKSNSIRNINFDLNKLLIINRDEGGIFSYDPATKRVDSAKNLKFKKPVDELLISGDYAYSLTEQIAISTLNIKTNTQAPDELRKNDNINTPYCLFKTSDGKVLVGRRDGLYQFNGALLQKVSDLKNIPVYSIAEDREHKIVVTSANEIFILNNYKTENVLHPKFKPNAKTFLSSGEKEISKLSIDIYNRYWFTAYPGNNLYMLENNSLYDVFELLNISTNLINCITKDKNNNIWIGTFTDGVYFIQNSFLNNFSLNFNKKNLSVNELILKNNWAITATSNGLFAYNYKTTEAKTLSYPDESFPEPIYNMVFDNNNFYYSKGFSFKTGITNVNDEKGILKFNPIVSKYVYLLNNKPAQNITGTQALIVNLGSVYKINLSNEKVIDTLISFSDYKIKINSMLIRDNDLFIGTSSGLTLLNLKDKSFKNFTEFPSINQITLINGKIYIAHDNGLSIYEDNLPADAKAELRQAGKLIQQIGEIKLTAVKKIKYFDDKIWLATLNGLYLCDTQFNPLMVYNKSNGLLSNSINDITFDNNIACIATGNGISFSNLKELTTSRFKPENVKIEYYGIDSATFFNAPENIKITAAQNDLYIYFSSPLFSKPNKQFFKYQSDNGKWTDVDNSPLHLAPSGGKHQIQIKASADNINWSDPVTITVEKEIKFTETGGVYFAITIGSLLIIILISYFWIKQVKKKAVKRVQEEQQINLLKHQAMNSLLSPHFIFNSLTSIQNYINTNNSLMASEYLAKFSRLIRMIIEKASQSQISLKDEVARLNYYLELEKERFKNKFDFKIHVDPVLDVENVTIPNMIIQPHAENSIIHGILPKNAHGTLVISFNKNKNNELIITIEDDGIGFIKAKEFAKSSHKSLGTSTISNILEINSKLYNKKQSVKMEDKSLFNPPSNGTLTTITIEL